MTDQLPIRERDQIRRDCAVKLRAVQISERFHAARYGQPARLLPCPRTALRKRPATRWISDITALMSKITVPL